MRVSKPPEERRAELIGAARRLFDKNGVQNTRVSDIVSEVGVAQGVFYYYFPSKKAMVEAVVSEVSAEVGAAADAILADSAAPFTKKLAGVIKLYLGLVDQFLGDEETHLPPAVEMMENATPLSRCWQQLTQCLLALVRWGVAGGEISVAYPEAQAMVLLWGLWGLAGENLPSKEKIAAIVAQGLGLSQSELKRDLIIDEENAQ